MHARVYCNYLECSLVCMYIAAKHVTETDLALGALVQWFCSHPVGVFGLFFPSEIPCKLNLTDLIGLKGNSRSFQISSKTSRRKLALSVFFFLPLLLHAFSAPTFSIEISPPQTKYELKHIEIYQKDTLCHFHSPPFDCPSFQQRYTKMIKNDCTPRKLT